MRDKPGSRRFHRLLALAFTGSFVVTAAVLPSAVAHAEPPSPNTPAAAEFSDVKGDEWYASAAYALVERAAILKRADGSFDPGGSVTRAQLVYVLAEAIGLEASPGQPFFDVDPGDWFAGALGALFQKGAVEGTSLQMFLPERIVTRQEAVDLVMEALKTVRRDHPGAATELDLSQGQAQLWLGAFRDRPSIDPACAASIAGAYRLGILDAPADGWFFPAGALTRAEMVEMLHRAFMRPVPVRSTYPQDLPAATEYAPLAVGSKGALVSFLEAQLTALRYPCGPVDGVYDHRTRDAVMAFQKVERLKRTGKVNAQVWERLATASIPLARRSGIGTRCEVDVSRQVLFMITDNKVTKVIHVSTGRHGTRTGHFSIREKYKGWVRCVTVDGKMYYPSYVVSKTAIHGYSSVPSYPASHGCVRVPVWTAEKLYYELPTGTVVDIFY